MGLEEGMRAVLTDVDGFSRRVIGVPLRPYQLEPARAILDSALRRRGLSFSVMMARQAGKDQAVNRRIHHSQREPRGLALRGRNGQMTRSRTRRRRPHKIAQALRAAPESTRPLPVAETVRLLGAVVQCIAEVLRIIAGRNACPPS